MAQSLGDAVLDLRTDDSAFDRGIKTARQQADRLAKSFERIGKRLTTFVTAPIAAFAVGLTRLADTQIRAEQRLAATLRITGDQAEERLEGLKEFASALQEVTTVGDEATLQNIQVAKSMGLTDQQASRAAKNALALAAAFGINERSAIRYTAALEKGDSTMLNRYIPTLRNIEDETQRSAEAQRILGQAFQVAVEEARTGLGPFRQLTNSMGDLGEQFGIIILEFINPFIQNIHRLVLRLQTLDGQTRRSILIIGGIAAAIGPGLIALGILTRVLSFATTGLAIFGRVAALVSLLFLRRWRLMISVLVAAGLAFAAFRDQLQRTFDELSDLIGPLGEVPEALDNLELRAASAGERAGDLSDEFQRLLNRSSELSGQLGQVSNEMENVDTVTKDLGKSFQELGSRTSIADELSQDFSFSITSGLTDAVTRSSSLSDAFLQIASSIQRAIVQAVIFRTVTSTLGSLFSGGGSGAVEAGTGLVARQFGGPVAARQPSIVGEAGPELFVPNVSGQVVSSRGLRGLQTMGPTFNVDMRGASVEAVEQLKRFVQSVNGSIESRAVSSVVSARRRNPNLF